MASLHSVTLDEEGCSHYYHCVFRHIPATMPLQMVASFVVPKESSPIVKELEALGCKIVPHKLHCYKEPLPTKFGYVTFYIHHRADGTRDDVKMHQLFLQWLRNEVPAQCEAGVVIQLGQPSSCCQAGEFLRPFSSTCKIFSPTGARDAKKVETFLLGYTHFNDDVADESTPGSPNAAGADKEHRTFRPWGCVGYVCPEEMPAVELAWLRKEHHDFPEKATLAALNAFFADQLQPMLEVRPAPSTSSEHAAESSS